TTGLPAPSFRFRLTADTLGVRLYPSRCRADSGLSPFRNVRRRAHRKSTPKNLMLRGVKLYLLGYLLNFLRYGMYNLGEGIITGEFRSDILKAFLGMDILHFAGLALIVTGVLKLLKLREVHLLAIAGVLSLIGSVIPVIDTGNFAGNWFIGHFVTTNSETCCFVFFNWYIFVAAGMVFGKIIRGIENRDRLYKRLLIISCCVMAVYITLTFCFGTFSSVKITTIIQRVCRKPPDCCQST
ncbi:MAG: DUF1624 domain-containing protein, partial [Ruminococcus sp.]|nr:DUF1624 domain-containing protein [Ruminococcus sp.]